MVCCASPGPATAEPSTVDTFKARIGPDELQKLHDRLEALNKDISERGMLTLKGQRDPLLTGYAYVQVYDWDSYFENLYLSYYGDGVCCLNNFKAFLALQKPDGFHPTRLRKAGLGHVAAVQAVSGANRRARLEAK